MHAFGKLVGDLHFPVLLQPAGILYRRVGGRYVRCANTRLLISFAHACIGLTGMRDVLPLSGIGMNYG